jgi:hypothetical protein
MAGGGGILVIAVLGVHDDGKYSLSSQDGIIEN